MAGYSKTPLFKKLGYKSGYKVRTRNPPENYFDILQMPDDYIIDFNSFSIADREINIVHYFTKSREELEADFDNLVQSIVKDGMIWISWPKKASKVSTDLSEDIIRNLGLKLGIVDIKVAAVDNVWSGLKFVIRKQNR